MPHPTVDTSAYSYQWAPAVSKPTRCPRCLGPAEWLTGEPDVADGVSYMIRCPACNPGAGEKFPPSIRTTVKRAIAVMHGGVGRCTVPCCTTCMSV